MMFLRENDTRFVVTLAKAGSSVFAGEAQAEKFAPQALDSRLRGNDEREREDDVPTRE
ncbi:hypothetical protein ACFQ1C_12455 [Oceanisphaera ostreae]|uniref:Uncharacterized protein n=2 Tax=Oceanisphaera ostreae TaxID=914151 RepID=A0ABW3KN00_9GAMM